MDNSTQLSQQAEYVEFEFSSNAFVNIHHIPTFSSVTLTDEAKRQTTRCEMR